MPLRIRTALLLAAGAMLVLTGCIGMIQRATQPMIGPPCEEGELAVGMTAARVAAACGEPHRPKIVNPTDHTEQWIYCPIMYGGPDRMKATMCKRLGPTYYLNIRDGRLVAWTRMRRLWPPKYSDAGRFADP